MVHSTTMKKCLGSGSVIYIDFIKQKQISAATESITVTLYTKLGYLTWSHFLIINLLASILSSFSPFPPPCSLSSTFSFFYWETLRVYILSSKLMIFYDSVTIYVSVRSHTEKLCIKCLDQCQAHRMLSWSILSLW